jgi:hypothetical protein
MGNRSVTLGLILPEVPLSKVFSGKNLREGERLRQKIVHRLNNPLRIGADGELVSGRFVKEWLELGQVALPDFGGVVEETVEHDGFVELLRGNGRYGCFWRIVAGQ